MRLKTDLPRTATALALLILASCGGGDPPDLVPDDYSGWESTHPGYIAEPIAGHTAPVRRILVNPVGAAFDSAPPPENRYPDGTIFLKENYPALPENGSPPPAALTVMIKDRENPEALGGWLWIMIDGEGREQVVTGKFCISCHQGANAVHDLGSGNPDGEFRDFIFYPPFSRPPAPDAAGGT